MVNFYENNIKQDRRFHSVDRINDLLMLEPNTRAAIRAILGESPFPLIAFETYRSCERQQLLFNQGATKLKTVGVHHYGLACDLVKSVDGQPSWKGDYSFLGDLAKKHGLIWGGDWGSPEKHHDFIDSVHVQNCTVEQQDALFLGTWYPS